MLDEGEIEELMDILQKRKSIIEKLDGMAHSLAVQSSRAVQVLQEKVQHYEERLREYGLQIETEWV